MSLQVKQLGLSVLEQAEIADTVDLQRTEYGSVEGQVIGLTKYYSSPALVFQERLTGQKIVCVLTPQLASAIGPSHDWSEAWEGQFLRLGGKLIYATDGRLKRVNATHYEEIGWADIPLSAIRDIDILQGRTVQEHIDEFWGANFG